MPSLRQLCPAIKSICQILADRKRIEPNFCRPHLGLANGITPAEAAAIDLKLGHNKLKSLITKSAQTTKGQTKIEEYALEPQLGKRIGHIEIKRDADCVSIKPRGGLPKPIWREISHILFFNGVLLPLNRAEYKRTIHCIL